ncbi:hypothetical protein [Aliarcobacter butzleri]|uniref:hypothetical protein n=1 Tax=Aliarcobacter butzleri TaxID=28197 RepID=UPI00158775A6|nr:hypothetical protein [Aliarcobacter butzleri]NUW28985.1 hypothetical protein [Aliarcobacter butzleri]
MNNAKAIEVNEWEIENDFNTLKKAVEIISDKKKLEKVQNFAKQQKNTAEKILDTEYLKSIGIGRN